MRKKLTIGEVKSRLKGINPNIEVLSEEYINSTTKLKCKCLKDDCNYEWKAYWSHLSRGHGCPKCAGTIKLTLSEIKERLRYISPNIEILSDEYINSHSKLKCKCLICDYKWENNWGHLLQGVGCPSCAGNARLTLDEVKEQLKNVNSNIEIIAGEYKNNASKLRCQCLKNKCNHEWETSWQVLQQGCGCPKCAVESVTNKKRYTLEEVKQKLKNINPNILILSDTYENNTSKLKCKCLLDDYKWETTWKHLSKGHGCPKCANVSKLDINEIKHQLKIINPNIEIGSDKDINSKTKLKCKCLIEGCNFEWETVWSVLKNGGGCPKCAVKVNSDKLRYSLEIIKEKLKEINPNIEIVSKEYKDSNSKLKCKCLLPECNYEWEVVWNSLNQGNGCPKCGIKRSSENRKLSIDYVRGETQKNNPNIQILSNEYTNNLTKLKIKCLVDGYEWESTWATLSKEFNCPKCAIKSFADKRRYSLEFIKEKLQEINPNVIILSNEYVDSKTKLRVKCLIDNYEWDVIWSDLQQGYGCPQCAINNRTGENSYQWKGGITPLNNYLRGKLLQWKKDSMKACGYKCIFTGSKKFHIHHIYNFNQILQEVLNITKIPLYKEINKYTEKQLDILTNTCLELHNKYPLGVCLRKDIHEQYHSIYGNENNSSEQFEEFKSSYKINNGNSTSNNYSLVLFPLLIL